MDAAAARLDGAPELVDDEDRNQGQQPVAVGAVPVAVAGVVLIRENDLANLAARLVAESAARRVQEDRRMQLTEQERTRALAIKRAIRDDPDITEPVSDFWCGQLALIDGDDVAQSLLRVQQLHAFRQEYSVEESAEYGTRITRDFVRILPRFWMSLSFNEGRGNHVIVCDVANFNVGDLEKAHGGFEAWLQATYFMYHAMNPDFSAIRKGSIVLVENDKFDWKKNFGLNLFKRFYEELTSFYPLQWSKVKNFHTGMFFNLLQSMAKPFIPPRLYNTFEMGCICDLGRLDLLYMTPNVQTANARLLGSITRALEQRYKNETSFKL